MQLCARFCLLSYFLVKLHTKYDLKQYNVYSPVKHFTQICIQNKQKLEIWLEGILIFTFEVDKWHSLCPHRLQSRIHTFAMKCAACAATYVKWACTVYLHDWRSITTLNWRGSGALAYSTLCLVWSVACYILSRKKLKLCLELWEAFQTRNFTCACRMCRVFSQIRKNRICFPYMFQCWSHTFSTKRAHPLRRARRKFDNTLPFNRGIVAQRLELDV